MKIIQLQFDIPKNSVQQYLEVASFANINGMTLDLSALLLKSVEGQTGE